MSWSECSLNVVWNRLLLNYFHLWLYPFPVLSVPVILLPVQANAIYYKAENKETLQICLTLKGSVVLVFVHFKCVLVLSEAHRHQCNVYSTLVQHWNDVETMLIQPVFAQCSSSLKYFTVPLSSHHCLSSTPSCWEYSLGRLREGKIRGDTGERERRRGGLISE